MNKQIVSTLPVIILVGLITGIAISAENKEMPKEDVIDVPAIGEGLCVHNLFQSNMVLQRDKPVAVWGWAAPGEQVTVSFAGQTQTATADKDRAWKVMLTAMPANAQAQKMTVQGKDKTLTLENILVGDVWVLGGQSNMEAPLTDVENGQTGDCLGQLFRDQDPDDSCARMGMKKRRASRDSMSGADGSAAISAKAIGMSVRPRSQVNFPRLATFLCAASTWLRRSPSA